MAPGAIFTVNIPIQPVAGLRHDTFGPVPVGQGVIGRAFTQGKSISLNNPKADPLFRPGSDGPAGLSIQNIFATPLIVRGQAVGVLVVFNQREGSFSETDRGLLSSLASSVSRALEIAWLFQHLRQRQQELVESRDRLQAVIDGILHPIYTVDESLRLVAINETKAKRDGNIG